MSSGDIADRRAVPALVFQQIIVQHQQNFIGMQELSCIVNDAQPVSVSVRRHAHIKMFGCHIILKRPKSFLIRSRQMPSEKCIMIFMHGIYFTARGQQDGPQGGSADAVKRIQGNSHPFAADHFHINRINNIIQILIQRIYLLDEALFHGTVIIHDFYFTGIYVFTIFFNLTGLFFFCVPSAFRKNLDTVIESRVMAGSDHHAIFHAVPHHVEHYHRGRD